jgi:hypothetical protein
VRLRVLAAVLLLASAPATARADAPPQKALVHHAVSTQSAQAQEFFDEGLTLIYAFNRAEAQKRFRAAAAADPGLAMAWWGVALGAGPNLNYEMTAENWKTVREALAKAQPLLAGASPEERRLIEALAKRYPAKATTDPDAAAYRDAMAAVHRDYPADDDVATLYVESVMDADDWGFTDAGAPIGDTANLVAILDGVISRTPSHPGANHYFVHLNDSQATAGRALAAANRLSALPVEPAASHLKHMSGHIYFDLGLFAPMQHDNELAVDYDRAFAQATGQKPDALDYYFHNLDFYTGASLMLGDDPATARATGFFAEFETPDVPLILDRRQRFAEALAALPAPKKDATAGWLARWHYARGIALVSLGRTAAAETELAAMQAEIAATDGYRRRFLESQVTMLSARIAYARGDRAAAEAKLRGLIAAVAPLPPEVFPGSLYPIGEWLGWMLLQDGDGPGAEAAFRADLARTPHNPRSLYGLMQALSEQDRTAAGDGYALEIARNWRGSYADLRDKL